MGIKKFLYTIVTFLTIAAFFSGFCNIKISLAETITLTSADGYSYTVLDESAKTAEITGYTGSSSSITIPDTIDAYTITGIGASAFIDNTSLTSVSIPVSITSIGESAFSGCTSLSTISYAGSETQWDKITFGTDWNLNCSANITYAISYCDENGHTWDSGKVTKEATSQETGEMTYTCTVCGETKTETIEKIPAVLDTPVLNKTTPASNGIQVSWSKVSGATGYVVFRKTSSSSWSRIGTTTGTTYTDKTVSTGTIYYYTIRAYKGSLSTADKNKYNTSTYWSSYDTTGVTGKYIKTPTISSATATATGTTIKWSSVSGANGYAVWRKIDGGSWSRIGYSTSNSYTDKETLTSGKTYYYCIRAYSGDYATANANTFDSTYWSCSTSGKKIVYLSRPSLNDTVAASSGIKISWSKVSGASGYVVYRKVSGGSWKKLGTATGTSYTDKTATAGNKYYYTVRAYKGTYSTVIKHSYNALYWSGYNSTGVEGKYIKSPVITASTTSTGATTIKWSSVSGANGYVIWRKVSGGSWARIATTTSTSYTDKTSLTYGSTYYYSVRAYSGTYDNANSNTFESLYWSASSSSAKNIYLASPVLKSSVSAVAGGIKISWNSVKKANGYAVYRKKSGGSWSLIGTSTSTSYVDTATLSTGTTYYYTVRAYNGNLSTANSNKYNAAYWGGYNTTGIKVKYNLNVPKLNSASKTSSGIKVTWNKVSGATGYAVYKKTLGGSWSLLGTTTSTSYTDKSSIASDKVYYYTVRAYKGSISNANKNKYSISYWSGYNSTGVAYSDSEINLKAQSYTSTTDYLILVNISTHKVAIYSGSQYNWTRIKYWSCTTGKDGKTPTGSFTIGGKTLSRGHSYTSWYCTSIVGNNLFHSVLYQPGSKTKLKDGRLGMSLSNGCIRLALENSKYIYDNMPRGTRVIIYK